MFSSFCFEPFLHSAFERRIKCLIGFASSAGAEFVTFSDFFQNPQTCIRSAVDKNTEHQLEIFRYCQQKYIIFISFISLQVTATDGDKDRPENIVYFLTGQGIDTDRPDQSKFDINKTTGEIFVLKV